MFVATQRPSIAVRHRLSDLDFASSCNFDHRVGAHLSNIEAVALAPLGVRPRDQTAIEVRADQFRESMCVCGISRAHAVRLAQTVISALHARWPRLAFFARKNARLILRGDGELARARIRDGIGPAADATIRRNHRHGVEAVQPNDVALSRLRQRCALRGWRAESGGLRFRRIRLNALRAGAYPITFTIHIVLAARLASSGDERHQQCPQNNRAHSYKGTPSRRGVSTKEVNGPRPDGVWLVLNESGRRSSRNGRQQTRELGARNQDPDTTEHAIAADSHLRGVRRLAPRLLRMAAAEWRVGLSPCGAAVVAT